MKVKAALGGKFELRSFDEALLTSVSGSLVDLNRIIDQIVVERSVARSHHRDGKAGRLPIVGPATHLARVVAAELVERGTEGA